MWSSPWGCTCASSCLCTQGSSLPLLHYNIKSRMKDLWSVPPDRPSSSIDSAGVAIGGPGYWRWISIRVDWKVDIHSWAGEAKTHQQCPQEVSVCFSHHLWQPPGNTFCLNDQCRLASVEVKDALDQHATRVGTKLPALTCDLAEEELGELRCMA